MIPQPAESTKGRRRARSFGLDNWRTMLLVGWAIGVVSLLAYWLLPLAESASSWAVMVARTVFLIIYGTWAVMWLLERYQTGEDDVTHMEVGSIGRGALRACTFVFWVLVMAFLVAGESGVESLTTPTKVVLFGTGGLAALGRITITLVAEIRELIRKRDERLDAVLGVMAARQGGSPSAI